jgi:16S rRNA processing protein RimM
VSAELHTASPERFAALKRLFALDANGRRRELSLENSWAHKGVVVLKFAGVDTISAAESLVGSEIQVPRQERAVLPADEVYVSDLVGCAVRDRGREIGAVAGVLWGAGDAPLLVIEAPSLGRDVASYVSTEKEYLVPFAEAYLKGMDLERRVIEMELPEGLLDLDAPSPQKKRERSRKRGSR